MSTQQLEIIDNNQLTSELQILIQNIQNSNVEIHSNAIDILTKNIQPSETNTTTRLAKITKCIKPFLQDLKNVLEHMYEGENKMKIADILSFLLMSIGERGEMLKYKMMGHTNNLVQWGQEYTRNLTGEIMEKWQENLNPNEQKDDENEENKMEIEVDEHVNDYMIPLVSNVLEFHITHNAEIDAFDLSIEINKLELLEKYTHLARYEKLFLYALSCAQYYPDPVDKEIYQFALKLAIQHKQWIDVVRLMIKINNFEMLDSIIQMNIENTQLLKQIGILLSRIRDETTIEQITNEIVKENMTNEKLSTYFDKCIELLQLKDPKTPQQICTSAPVAQRITVRRVEEPKDSKEMGYCVANCLANAGFGYDSLIHQNDGEYVLTANSTLQLVSSSLLGLVHLWRPNDVEQFVSFLGSDSMYVRAGSLLGIGTSSTGITNETDFVQAFLLDKLDEESSGVERKLSILGMGIAYAGTRKLEIKETLLSIVNNVDTLGLESAAHACLSLGLIFEGTMDSEIVESIVSLIFSNSINDEFMKGIQSKMCIIGLSLLYMCRGRQADFITDTIKALPSPVNQYGMLAVTICAYAGSSNILVVQQLMEVCGNHSQQPENKPTTEEKEENKTQVNTEQENELKECGIAVLGIALVLMNDNLSSELSRRLIDEVQRYGDSVMKRFIPFALALTSIGKANVLLLEQLSRLAHSPDIITSRNAIISIGLVASGTIASRAIHLLDQLAAFYSNDAQSLYAIKVAQGLVHLGKGTITLNPSYSDKLLVDPISITGLLTFMMISGEGIERIYGLNTYIINLLALAMKPKILCLLDENDEIIQTSCRVGQAVDVAGQTGNPRNITGFQAHETPVCVGVGERAELATDEYSVTTSVLEGIIMVKNLMKK